MASLVDSLYTTSHQVTCSSTFNCSLLYDLLSPNLLSFLIGRLHASFRGENFQVMGLSFFFFFIYLIILTNITVFVRWAKIHMYISFLLLCNKLSQTLWLDTALIYYCTACRSEVQHSVTEFSG